MLELERRFVMETQSVLGSVLEVRLGGHAARIGKVSPSRSAVETRRCVSDYGI